MEEFFPPASVYYGQSMNYAATRVFWEKKVLEGGRADYQKPLVQFIH